jgi:hypothetical protein
MQKERAVGEEKEKCSKKIYNDIGLLFGGSIIVFFMVMGIGLDKISGFVDFYSLLFVGGILIGALIAGPGLRKTVNAIVYAIGKAVPNKDEGVYAIQLYDFAIKVSILSGVIGTFIGVINMLGGGMDDISALTAGAAVALITVFYALLLWGVLLIARMRVLDALQRLKGNDSN